ncbi:MAG: hypothetical protein KDC80_10875, partial [Saprospiraceae bacterium]|nr:hypothetical protein [Saprospiraceae bacterium]
MNQPQEISTTSKYIDSPPNYDKFPFISVTESSSDCICGWNEIIPTLINAIADKSPKSTIVFETYPGIDHTEILKMLTRELQPDSCINTLDLFKPEKELNALLSPFLGDHPIFGKLNDLELRDFFDPGKLELARDEIRARKTGIQLIFGPGAKDISEEISVLVYADLARWEIQQRMRRHEVDNLGFTNRREKASTLYKQAYFVDWRVADKQKMKTLPDADFLLDTNDRLTPKLIETSLYYRGLDKAITQPFRVVPFFDPGVWGGQWMKEVCDLDREEINYAWCFDCVPEENSLLLGFGDQRVEIPAINLVLSSPVALLGEKVFEKFGAEFPIRFDFLDTMEGGNLSLQVHPLKEYIKKEFGLDYTQDESYYLLDVEPDAVVYLGLKENV